MTYSATDYTDRKTAKVRVIFEIDPTSERRFKILAVRYNVIDLLNDIGSWAALMLAAYIILWWYQWLTKPFGNVTSYDVRHAAEILLTEADSIQAKKKRERFLEQAKEIESFIMEQARLAKEEERLRRDWRRQQPFHQDLKNKA